MTGRKDVEAFLRLPAEALPWARFQQEDDSWANDAWEVLRRHARTGEPIRQICGTNVVVGAERPEWSEGVLLGDDK